jgi:outer membrane protein OmpA-like peptidoglycan-associated protein
MKYLTPVILALGILLTACQERVRPASTTAYFNDANQALTHLTQSLSQQLAEVKAPANKTIPVDELFNEKSAEVASLGKTYQQKFSEKLGQANAGLQFARLNRKNIDTAEWIVLLSYASVSDKTPEHPGNWIRFKAAVADIVTGNHLASAEVYLSAKQFESEPSKFYKDAPMYLTDQRHKERVEIMHGKTAPLKQRMTVQAGFADATTDYENGNYVLSEAGFREVARLAPGHQGALTGIYQSLWQQNKKVAAEAAFAQLMAASVDAGNIAVRLLFKVGSVDFVEVADLPTQYQLWLKALGQTIHSKSRCLDITGHASRSGSSELNERLSLQRASRIVSLMQQSTPGVIGKLKAYGKGFQETLVGTGTNDATDAIDRRVEFIPRAC